MLRQAALCAAFITLLWGSVPAQGPADVKSQFTEGFAKATEFYRQRNLDSARTELQLVVRQADKLPAEQGGGAAARSFLALVEFERGRFDEASRMHTDAVTLARLSLPPSDSIRQLCLLRQGEFLHSRNQRSQAQALLQEVVDVELATERPNIEYTARARKALAESFLAEQKWEQAGRAAHFARLDVQRLFGQETLEQLPLLAIMAECAIRLERLPLATPLLEDYRARMLAQLENPENETTSLPPDQLATYDRLRELMTDLEQKTEEANLLASRRRFGVLANKTLNPLKPGDVGFLITVPRMEKLRTQFNLQKADGINGTKVDYGPHTSNDAALCLLLENDSVMLKATVGVTLDSPLLKADELHPALVDFTDLVFFPNGVAPKEWLLGRVNATDVNLGFEDTFTQDGRRMVVSRDREMGLLLVEYFPNTP